MSPELSAPGAVSIRPLQAGDSLEEITDLLHRAYAVLAGMGLRYMATHQSVEVTPSRVAQGECFVATRGQAIVGTIVFRNGAQTGGCPWYDRPEVASFGQFAVEPRLQSNGLGRRLIAHVEERARGTGRAKSRSIRRSPRGTSSTGMAGSDIDSSRPPTGVTPTIAAW